MDIKAIEDNIKELEEEVTSVDNVRELANLYIVRDNLLKRDTNNEDKELTDILPAYSQYCEIKRQYQLKQIPDDAVIQSMTLLCNELQDFLEILYCGTDFYRERKILVKTLQQINKKCSK